MGMMRPCPIRYGVKLGLSGDLYADNVVSLLHFDGAHNDVVPFYDEIATTGNLQANVGNNLSSTQVKYGATSLELSDVNAGTAPIKDFSSFTWEVDALFTIEGWFYFVDYYPSANSYLLRMDIDGYGITLCDVEIKATTKYLTLTGYGGGPVNTTTAMPIGAWTHMAITHDGATLRLFMDGVLIASFASVLPTGNPPLQVSAFYTSRRGSITRAFFGYVDDLRITYNVCRYSSNFTPPTEAFPNP
jgi:hypothetical protein